MNVAHRRLIQLIELLLSTLLILLLLVVVHRFLFTIVRVDGPSMEPTLPSAAVVVVERARGSLSRGQVVGVVLTSGQKLVKRVIALPTESVVVAQGRVTIGELRIREPYIGETETEGNVELHLADDDYFLLGDNRANSLDSRQYGAIKRSEIIGPVRAVLWPAFKVF